MSGSPEAPETNFDKKMTYDAIDTAVGDMFDQYGDDIPEEVQDRGEQIRSTADAISRQLDVTSRETFIAALDFKKHNGTLSQENYDFIVDHI